MGKKKKKKIEDAVDLTESIEAEVVITADKGDIFDFSMASKLMKNLELGYYTWQTAHGAMASVTLPALEKAKQRHECDGDNALFVRVIQPKIDWIATANPRWSMQQVIEELGK